MTETPYLPYHMADVRKAMAIPRFSFGSGFSGCGGADIGYAHAGGRCVFSIELDPEAVRTLGRNFPETHIEHRDFREVAASPNIINRLLHQGGLRQGELELLHLSPPCNEWSRLGPGPRQGGTAGLIFDVMNMTKVARSKVLVLENVPELAKRYSHFLEAALRSLCFDETGRRLYYANHRDLIASDYGVPQHRNRLFLIAVRADVAKAVNIDSDHAVLNLFRAPTHVPISVEAALADLQQSETDLQPFKRSMMVSNLGRVVPLLIHNPEKWIRTRDAGLGNYRFSLVCAALRLPSPTLTASGQQPDGRSGVIHPLVDRKFTVRETMRLQAFPDDFELTGTVAQAATRIGMSVAPLVTKAIAESIYERVLEPHRRLAG